MKNSGIECIGEIPDDWRTIKVKYVLTANDGGLWGNDPLNLESDKIVLRSTEQTVDGLWNITNPATRDLSHLSYSRFIIKSGDLLMTKSSGSKAHIGKTTLAGAFFDRHECYYSNFIQRLRLNNQSSPKYFWYIFNSIFTREQFVYLQNSTSGIGNINSDNIRSIVIPFITLQDQQKIADYLDKKCAAVDRLIENQRAQIEKLKEYKQSVITEAITCGLDPSAPMKDSGVGWIGDIPKGWEMLKMVQVCNLITDYVASGSFADLANNVTYLDYPDYALLVRTIDVSGKGHNAQCVYINKHAYDFLANSNLYGGELMFPNIGASVGDVYIVPKLYEKMSLAPNSIMVRAKYNNKFIYYYFSTTIGRFSLLDIAQSTAQPKFNKTDFRQLKIIFPEIEEQRQIVDYLDKKCAEIDKLIAIKQQKIENLTEYKKSLIYEYVTGKKQVG